MEFYTRDDLFELMENDEISDEEEGFMIGFLHAFKKQG